MADSRTTDSRITVRRAAALWGVLRAGVGVAALVAPRALARPWVGSVRPRHSGDVLGRALGGRDLGLAAGMISAARGDGDMLPWIVACGGADAVDTAATLAAWPNLPRRGRWLVLAAAGGSVVAAAGLAVLSGGEAVSRRGRPV